MDKKTSLRLRRKSSINILGNKFCVSVDGSKFSDFGFELVLNEFFKKRDKLLVTHISNQDNLNNTPFIALPDTIQTRYETKLLGKLLQQDYNIVIQPLDKNMVHAIEQVFDICVANNCNIMMLGFQGYKADKIKKEITKGTIFMIENVHIPTFILKDYTPRSEKPTEGYRWFVGIENSNSKSFN